MAENDSTTGEHELNNIKALRAEMKTNLRIVVFLFLGAFFGFALVLGSACFYLRSLHLSTYAYYVCVFLAFLLALAGGVLGYVVWYAFLFLIFKILTAIRRLCHL